MACGLRQVDMENSLSGGGVELTVSEERPPPLRKDEWEWLRKSKSREKFLLLLLLVTSHWSADLLG